MAGTPIDADSLGGWRLDRWQAERSRPYNTVPGYDPDHWFELPLANEHLFQSVRLQNFPTRIIPGRLFTSRMPRSLHREPRAAARFAEKARLSQLRLVIVLTEAKEYVQYAGTGDLVGFYKALGADVLARPIPDFGVPQRQYLAEVIDKATLALADGSNVLVHCAGGSGRTGIVVCGVLRNLGVHDAIAWARRQKSSYVETEEQRQVVESMPLTITAELVKKHPLLVEVMVAEMSALAVARARAGSFDHAMPIDPTMLDAFQALFDLLDSDEDGRVTVAAAASEVEAILTEQQQQPADGTAGGVSVRRLLGAVDLDGDDEVSFREFCLVMSQPLLPPLSEVVIEQHVHAAAVSSGGGSSEDHAVAAAKEFEKAWQSADAGTRAKMMNAVGQDAIKTMGSMRSRL